VLLVLLTDRSPPSTCVKPEDSELSEPGKETGFSEEEGPQAAEEQQAAAVARSTDL